MTEFLDIEGGRIGYDVTGQGPLIVLSPGIGDLRQAYRFLAPQLAQAGYRVAAADLRGHGDSSLGSWTSISRTDVAGDLLALIRHLGAPGVIVGQSRRAGRPPSPRRRPRSWSARWLRSTRSPACRRSISAPWCGSGATGAEGC